MNRRTASLLCLRHRAHARGYTLTELMIVVAMIGVLSALAVVGYRKYIDSAKISEPLSLIQSIRSAEEEFKDKTMAYMNVSTDYFPRNTFDGKKMGWANAGHPDYLKWQTLGVVASGPVRFGYRVNSGAAGVAIALPIDYSPVPAMPSPPPNPWYVVQGKGDPNEDGKPTVLIATSFSTEVLYNEDQ